MNATAVTVCTATITLVTLGFDKRTGETNALGLTIVFPAPANVENDFRRARVDVLGPENVKTHLRSIKAQSTADILGCAAEIRMTGTSVEFLRFIEPGLDHEFIPHPEHGNCSHMVSIGPGLDDCGYPKERHPVVPSPP